MLEDAEEHRRKQEDRGRIRTDPNNQGQTQTSDKRETRHIEGAEVKGAEAIDSLRTVMHLMESPEKESIFMERAMPQVEHRLIDEQTDAGTGYRAEVSEIENSILSKKGIPQHR